jgi:hypothetical protein
MGLIKSDRGFPGFFEAQVTLEIVVQEFSASGAFIRNIVGPPTTVLDESQFIIPGVRLRVNERFRRVASIHRQSWQDVNISP